MRVIYGKYHSDEVILAMVRAPEKHQYLTKIFQPLIDNLPNSVMVNDLPVDLQYFLGADMKFINEMTGIGACFFEKIGG